LLILISFLFKIQIAESKKSGGFPVTIQYKEEIEVILDKNRPTLDLKSCIDSSESLKKKDLNQKNLVEIAEQNQIKIPYEISKISRKHKIKHKGNYVNRAPKSDDFIEN
jgi:hypothetical protein